MMETSHRQFPVKRILAVIDGGKNFGVGASPSSTDQKLKLLDRVRQAIRTRHYSYMTEKAYFHRIKRFIFASDAHVTASTHHQPFNILLFLYKEVLGKKIGGSRMCAGEETAPSNGGFCRTPSNDGAALSVV